MRRLRNLIAALALSLAACGGGGPTLAIAPAPASSLAAYSVLYSFAGSSDGSQPYAGLIQDSNGNLYGTTYNGGIGFGTVFQLTPPIPPATHWTETVLYSFAGGSDGASPRAGMILDSAGNLYGTTYRGGAYTLGTVFELTPSGTEKVLYSFAGGSDGANPRAGLIRDSSNGNLYGTTYAGGTPTLGTVFRLAPPGPSTTNWTETVLHSFTGSNDGAYPRAGLILDSAGNLYGTTSGGMLGSSLGTVFELSPPGSSSSSWTETLLHSFAGGNTDGALPYAGLIRDSLGNLYGTTSIGGSMGGGTVFRLAPPIPPAANWTETLLYSFLNTPDGASPYAGLIQDSAGNLYGTTSGGGYGAGSVFQLSPPISPAPNWTETVLYSFAGGSDGANPRAGLVQDSAGNLYGTTYSGGASSFGTVFELTP